jgi:hypothetical protein
LALNRQLGDIRDAVMRTADVAAFTDKHPATYVNDLVNRGLGALSRVCRTTNPEFQPVASTTITMDGSATVYGLPGNFRSLISVVYTDSNKRKTWMQPLEWPERAVLTTPETVSHATRAAGYQLVGTNIEFLPKPPKNDTALLWFATSVTQLSGDSSVFDTMERLDQYVIWWAAREIAQERENWSRVDRLAQRLGEMEGDIRILARSLDLSAPGRVANLRLAGHYRDRFGRRYRCR